MTLQQLQSSLRPVTLFKGWALFVMLGYFHTTTEPGTGMLDYYTATSPLVGAVLVTLLPVLCIIGIIAIVLFGDENPIRATLPAMFAQGLYTIFSIGWFTGRYVSGDPLTPIAIYAHLSITLALLLVAYREAYDHDISTG